MDKKIQLLSDLNGKIVASCEQSANSGKKEGSPVGCTLVGRDGLRLDVIEVDAKMRKLARSELFNRCELHTASKSTAKLVVMD